jgi:hypothetical protein
MTVDVDRLAAIFAATEHPDVAAALEATEHDRLHTHAVRIVSELELHHELVAEPMRAAPLELDRLRREAGWLTAAEAAAHLGVSVPRVYALRKAGEVRAVGSTGTEEHRLRKAAGWAPDARGWSARVLFWRDSLDGRPA